MLEWEPTSCILSILFDTYCHSDAFMAAVHPGTSWLIDAKPLATKLYQCQYHGSIFLYFEFSLYSLFFAIYQTTETLLLVAFIPQEYTHPRPTPLLSNHSTMALTKTLKPSKTTTSIIKTRAQSRTGTTARTGTNVRTNDGTIAPVPVTVTTGRTIDVAPAPADLFANRPKTGALKDPPVPRDRDSDDDAKKPAAKPKPTKVAPKATRKPHKPRNVDANKLVDPMSRVHVDDATGVVTAGGLARAGGNDPLLTNPEQLEPEPLDEPQPKKKTRRAVDRRSRASRANRAGHGDDDDDEDSSSTTVGSGTGGYGNGGNGSGDDDGYDDFDPDADSIADSQGVPEATGLYAPIIIGDTPEERGFSMYLSGPPFNCTNTARKVLHFQHFKTWHDVRLKSHDDIVKSFAASMSKYDTACCSCWKQVPLHTCPWSQLGPPDPTPRTPCVCSPSLAYPA